MAENGEIQSMYSVNCPNCSDGIGETVYDAIVGDLVNGATVECPSCGHELDLRVYVAVDDLDYEEED